METFNPPNLEPTFEQVQAAPAVAVVDDVNFEIANLHRAVRAEIEPGVLRSEDVDELADMSMLLMSSVW